MSGSLLRASKMWLKIAVNERLCPTSSYAALSLATKSSLSLLIA